MTRRDVPKFGVAVGADGPVTVLTVRGELDIASAAVLRDALLRLVQDEVPDLAVDGAGITFVDSSGLAVLLMAARRWGQAGKRILLRNPSTTLTRIVDLTGVRRAFEFEGQGGAG